MELSGLKRIFCLIIAVVVLAAMACPAFAAENEFVPSIPYKGSPDIVEIEDEDGNPAIGRIVEDGETIDYIYAACLVVTPVSEAKTSTLIPDHAEELLLDVYDKLTKGTMTIPYEKHSDSLKGKTLVIRDLFDASWLCDDHPVIVAQPGVTVELIFDLGVAPDDEVYCMTYKNNEWNPIVSLVNNGDGTVTCVFEDFCPIEFSIVRASSPSETGDNMNVGLWIALMAISAAALVVLVVVKNRNSGR